MKQQNNTKTALIYAVDLLAIRPYSTQQLIPKLKRKEYAPEEIQEAINRLTARHYLDDTDLCQRQYQAYINEKHRSIKAIKYKLMEKGFSQSDIQNAQEETDIDEIDYEYTVCLRLLNSRYIPSKSDKLKCQGYINLSPKILIYFGGFLIENYLCLIEFLPKRFFRLLTTVSLPSIQNSRLPLIIFLLLIKYI